MVSDNQDVYKIQARVAKKYKPIIVRGHPLHEQPSKFTFPEKRKAGATNLDLWLDGSLYPADAVTQRPPTFHSLPDFLEFVGEGERGLLGYVKNLHNSSGSTSLLVQHKDIEISVLQARIDDLLQSFGREQANFESRRVHDMSHLQSENHHLQTQVCQLEESICALTRDHDFSNHELCHKREAFDILHAQLEQLDAVNHQRIQHLRWQYEKQLLVLNDNSARAMCNVQKLQQKIERMKKTPFGYRSQVKPRKDILSLSKSGGHGKAARRFARAVLTPATSTRIQNQNFASSSHRRLCGSIEDQVASGKLFAVLLTKTELQSIIQLPSHTDTRMQVENSYLNKIGESIGPHEVLQTCDESGITQKGYSALYKKFKGGLQSAGKHLRLGCLPNPHQVSTLRIEMNSRLAELIGDFYTIDMDVEVKQKNKETRRLHLNEFNTFFADLESVQRTMVKLYGITPTEMNGSPLIFVLKMDEAEVVNKQKMERISITIMNRALDPAVTKDSEEYFSVQAEREIWPIGCFQIPKENFEILSAVFKRTQIPFIIQSQSDGQQLSVDGVGDFQVQWHLSGDMKTIKALYGLGNGAIGPYCCIYCNQKKTQDKVLSSSQAISAAQKRNASWNGGLFAKNVSARPISDPMTLARWRPIIPIPLERVHVCTLHGFNRICEKLLHMHFQFVWTISNVHLQRAAIEDLQKLLSAIGMHGGDVEIFEDKDLSGKSNSVPRKPSLSGSHAQKLFKPSTIRGGSNTVYKEVVLAERNYLENGVARHGRLQVWIALEKLIPYFTGLTLSMEQRNSFKGLVENFGSLYVKHFGEHHVTHYIHVLVKHGPYFVERYGSLSVWSCQGMEFSHHAAKAAYHRHTQHGGSLHKKSPILQTYEHWYRIVQHRFYNKEHESEEDKNLESEERVRKRREASVNSSAIEHAAAWRAQCTRVGSRWIRNTTEASE